MKAVWFLLLAMNAGMHAGWAAEFPVDTVISIPNAPGADSIRVRISALDTDLTFFTTQGTASCPGSFSGDIKNVKKTAAFELPQSNQDYSLWSTVATCGTGPNSSSALNTYYEYSFTYRRKTLYLNFTKFIGPSSFPSGTFPQIAFQIDIDTVSHIRPAALRRTLPEPGRGKTRSRGFDLKGRRAKGLAKLP